MTDVNEPYPDIEVNPRQKDGDSQSHGPLPHTLRHRKSKEGEEHIQDCFGETPGDQVQALYQPKYGQIVTTWFL